MESVLSLKQKTKHQLLSNCLQVLTKSFLTDRLKIIFDDFSI